MEAASHLYLIALGSNERCRHLGNPQKIVRHALDALEMPDIDVFVSSPIIPSHPLGPSRREYANAAALIVSPLDPPRLLSRLQAVEAHFGRNRRGQKWRARTLDIDIILWSGGIWTSSSPPLAIPHPEFHGRGFVLEPAAKIAGTMRDPLTGLTIRQLHSRFLHPKPLDRRAKPA
ncbi:MAG: 2-amino-4-hydroxy-6-hydroxymethyldihydropteridine diphosphokinase [Sphingorhabdus sp.]